MVPDAYQRLHTDGNIIDLHICPVHSVPRAIQAKIIQLHELFTPSCVSTVEINASDLRHPGTSVKPIKAILNLYDRRFATKLRKDEKVEPLSEATEQAFVAIVKNGEAAGFIRKYAMTISTSKSPKRAAYDILKVLQGKQIPRLYSAVSLPLDFGSSSRYVEQDIDLSSISGTLLEYIPGPTLSTMTEVVPRQIWHGTVDQAVDIVRTYSNLGIMNKDVQCSNFVINGAVPDGDEHRVVVLDFELCELRGDEQFEEEWGRAKWSQDEEGAVGAVMKTRLAKLGFELDMQSGKKMGIDAVADIAVL
ncbi:hypothetical protein CERZMDRAFT_95736 [Cercospora zeae-maydis SCOH1-5]|uniref:Protein kinase domain-containing protein n=1 Tax=Cercospora zeae-maydis SCOH1-5 TaxID=717836 RepID=A0A6A6FM58_9PEZI|nr:hypothetical protein CERZMDRAFT_95736 [Cercospora zeae-maydis SCOH1-5]